MQTLVTTTKAPTTGANGTGFPWTNPNNITLDDGSSAVFFPGGSATGSIIASGFDFSEISSSAIITGIAVNINGSIGSCDNDYDLNITGSETKQTAGAVTDPVIGGAEDLWGLSEITLADLSGLTLTIDATANGASASESIDYISISVYWEINIAAAPAEVPSRVDYKVYARDGTYLGLLPNVFSELKFSQDKNSAGATLEIKSAQDLREVTEIGILQTESDLDILTESDYQIFTEATDIFVTTGNNDDYAVFKNSNRVEAWLYNYWYPNGKRMFKGQVNKITFSYGGNGDSVNLLVYSDGYDMANYIARSSAFTYTDDVSQTNSASYTTISNTGLPFKPTVVYVGQSWLTGAVTNLGQIKLRLYGYATAVTVTVKSSVSGTVLGSVTRSVSTSGWEVVPFQFATPITVTSATNYYFDVTVSNGYSLQVGHSTSSVYANGQMYLNDVAQSKDLYFVTGSGIPSTTATYTSSDPVTGIASDILADYNNRGGYITENVFDATGLSITYTWILSNIFDVLNKIIELSPIGWYFYVNLGEALIDIKEINSVADYTVISGVDIHQLDVSLSIENVSNQLLFTGGDTGTENLYRAYLDSESSGKYGLRTRTKTDNRVTLTATADAIGETFIAENSDEVQETRITILNKTMDITLLTPGKTIGFRSFSNMIDDFILQIVRRDYTPDAVVLTLGRLPTNLSNTVQNLNRGLLNEQTINNPNTPS